DDGRLRRRFGPGPLGVLVAHWPQRPGRRRPASFHPAQTVVLVMDAPAGGQRPRDFAVEGIARVVDVVSLVEDGALAHTGSVALHVLGVAARRRAPHEIAGLVVETLYRVRLPAVGLHLTQDAAGGVPMEDDLAAGVGDARQLPAGIVLE